MRTVNWNNQSQKLELIDQRKLPGIYEIVAYENHQDVIDAIKTMVVRGAPAIGITAAFALALCGLESKSNDTDRLIKDIERGAKDLERARPTAVNLRWAIEKMMRFIRSGKELQADKLRIAIIDFAQKLADEDIEINMKMAKFGSQLIMDGDTIIHHCNTGSLAAVDWGTALGAIRMANEEGKRVHVLVDETRPRLQGARLTAWELQQYNIPFDIITDNAAGYFLSAKKVHKVFFGADRVARNGDVVNKIGTYMLALAANDNQIPTYSVLPTSTIDKMVNSGEFIPIEERPQNEVLDIKLGNENVVPSGSTARNPAFDVTPNRLITAIITEHGILYPPYVDSINQCLDSIDTIYESEGEK